MIALDLKHAKISENPTVDELEAEINRLTQMHTVHANMDESLKRLINSIYGVLGYLKFPCYHIPTALAVTQQAADLLQYAESSINHYFWNIWPTDYEVHKQLGLTYVNKSESPAVIYMDTDSTFIAVGNVLKNCDYKGDEIEFILTLHKIRLDAYVKQKMHEYCIPYGAFTEKFDGSPSFNFAFEQISEAVIWVAKKKYIKHLRYYKKARYDRMKKVDIRGLETRQASTPKFVREELNRLFLYMTDKGKKLSRQAMTAELQNIKKQFNLLPMDSICKITRLGQFDKQKINDTTRVEYISGTDAEVKGALLYNYMLNQRPELKKKYSMIEQGNRVKWYYMKKPFGEVETFAFHPDAHPYEFAPEISINTQFEKLVLAPVNNVVESLNMKLIPKSLITVPELW